MEWQISNSYIHLSIRDLVAYHFQGGEFFYGLKPDLDIKDGGKVFRVHDPWLDSL